MDVRNYLSFLWRIKWKAIVVGIVCGVSAFVYTSSFSEKSYEAIVFMSIGMEQGVYPDQAEAFGARGVTEADYYFAQTVQGWSMDPSFGDQVNERVSGSVSVTARQQERQNVIFSIIGNDEEIVNLAATATVDELTERLASYNGTMETSYKVANPEITIWTHEPKVLFNGLIGFLFGVLLVVGFYLVYEYFTGTVSFAFQAGEVFGKKSLCAIDVCIRKQAYSRGPFRPVCCEKQMGEKLKFVSNVINKGVYVLGVGMDLSAIKGDIEEVIDGKVVSGEFKKGDYLLFVKVGCAKEKDLEFLKRFADSVEWVEI
ncbi:MAG: hypothetical protein WCT46_00125 [Candidatus Gracilibacteria bacterium]